MAYTGWTASPSWRSEARGQILTSILTPHRKRLAKMGTLVTAGTHAFLERNILEGRGRRAPRWHIRLRPGHNGGTIEIANAVVNDLCKTVVFISDPDDPTLDSPDNRALVRVCIHKRATLIQTIDDLAYWLK